MTAARAMLTHPAAVLACRLVLGLVFLWAGLAKIGDLKTFAGDVHNFRMLPIALEPLVAMTLPWVELVAGLALVTGLRARAGAVVVLGMMLLFTVGVGQAIARGLDLHCGCFGTADATSVGWSKLLQNVGLTAMAAIASTTRRGD